MLERLKAVEVLMEELEYEQVSMQVVQCLEDCVGEKVEKWQEIVNDTGFAGEVCSYPVLEVRGGKVRTLRCCCYGNVRWKMSGWASRVLKRKLSGLQMELPRH